MENTTPGSIEELIENHAEVAPANPVAVESEQRRMAEENAEGSANGDASDPTNYVAPGDEFERDEAGNIKLTRDGKPRRKRGRKKGAAVAPQTGVAGGDTSPVAQPTTAPVVDEAVATGVTTAHLVTSLATMTLGAEWQPTEPELIGMSDAYAAVYRHYGIGEVHPVIAAMVVTFAYAAPRFNTPNTQAKLQNVAGWFKSKIGGKKSNEDEDSIGNRL